MNLKISSAVLAVAITASFTTAAFADEPPGSRYALERYYKSEISVAEAYLAMEHSKGFKNVAKELKPVLIDVRSLPEYAAGHPEDAYNVPYPRIGFPTSYDEDTETWTPPIDDTRYYLPQEKQQFYDEVYRIVDGNLDTPIMTLCRTGHRSVLAGNILANPNANEVVGEKFTNVRNIWEGFVGQPKYAYSSWHVKLDIHTNDSGETVLDGGPYILDLDNDDKVYPVQADTADVYEEIRDANPEKDGWRNFAGLPFSTHIQKPLAYERDPSYYKALYLTPVE
jgi:rhodanese-related sulfurtransferase